MDMNMSETALRAVVQAHFERLDAEIIAEFEQYRKLHGIPPAAPEPAVNFSELVWEPF
jgi:hypothetical protein